MKKTPPPFKDERKQTDDSLTLERGKTDESFHSGRGDTHDNTDDTVAKDRIAADQDKLKRRSAADLKRDVPEGAGQVLEKQRKVDDKAIETERSNMDTALQHERDEKERLLNKLVIQERNATDKNLKDERVKTDLEVERSAVLLAVERTALKETKSALTTREEFVAIVSHDLRNPIGAILSSTEILLEDTSIVGKSDTTKSLIELIQRNAKTSLRLISDILDMERIVEGKLQLQLTKNRIHDLIRESVESFAYAASAEKILLKIAPVKTGGSLLCDKDRVAQILSNLIGNALKFTPAGGSVTVEVLESPNEVTVSVCDTGPGIPDDQKSRIFERFTQIGNKQRGGLGLGLYISKTLVESHSGKLWVTSIPGSGCTFWFTLPISGR